MHTLTSVQIIAGSLALFVAGGFGGVIAMAFPASVGTRQTTWRTM